MAWTPSATDTPYARLGGEERVRRLVERFYDAMEAQEPALARLHKLDEAGRVSRESRDKFGLFLMGWLGGPQTYTATQGHPRLRQRHARVAVDVSMRDAWLRAMSRAMDEEGLDAELRAFLALRFAEVANFLRNVDGP